ncbi:hypothetical protein GCM10023084_20540 [Streptomyces lacrimifluminis]|uniref:Uncharacterized protein n=1 Tax=Streptomyces lacrimifluminis TaxID=1500077 RepID=A0A917NXK4_9ACTN|nr:hypothetical protein GCM10012282_34750 [Streptomyces lacrimifluminis]
MGHRLRGRPGEGEGQDDSDRAGSKRLPVSDDIRDRVTTCADLARLDDWLDRVGTAERTEDLFTGEPDGVTGGAPEQG